MLTITDSPQLDLIFGSLANGKRRAIIHDLALQPATVGRLAKFHQLSLPAIHKHIRNLENANLIVRRKSGRTNFVALNQESLSLAQQWTQQYQTQWGNAKASLENYILGN